VLVLTFLSYDIILYVMGHNIEGDTSVKIADSIESEVAAGRLRPGDRLPAVRSLAGELGVNRNTVSAAYQRLATAGLVVAGGRRGTRVAAAPPVAPAAGRTRPGPGIRCLEVGGPDPDLLPPLAPVLRQLEPPVRNYGEETNLAELLEVGRQYFANDGFRKGRLAVASGALDSLERLLRVHLRPGDAVGIEDPGFLAGVALVRSLGLHTVPVKVDEEGAIPDALHRALRQRVRAVILTPRAQNPSGACLTRRRARALREVLSRDPRVLVLEDDHCGPIAGAPAISVAYGHRGPWAMVRSVGKFLGPDLRLGFILGDEPTVARLEGHMALGTRWVSHLLQHIVVRLWADPSVHRLVERAARTYDDRRTALLRELRNRGVHAFGRSGLNVWVPVAREVDTVQGLLQQGWAVAAGEGFRLESQPGIRITTSALEPADSERLAADLAGLLSPAGMSSVA
jgi:DNA-binding transcriptional MocR family regulator